MNGSLRVDNLTAIGRDIYASNIKYFSILDYGLFISMLLISISIGIYYGFLAKQKQNNTAEYILGSKEMSVFPVAASLIASHISGITMLALPADTYAHGTQYCMCFICLIIVGFAAIKLYIPVFFDLQITSCFLYLEKRFDRRVKVTASLVYAMGGILIIPIVIYVPALAFNQVSGINVHLTSLGISVLCIFYTTIGGIRAVVWTDTIQFVSIFGATMTVMFLGTSSLGGVTNVFEAAERGGRLIFFDMNPDPFVRTSFWTVSLGMTTMWIAQMSVNQSTVQRCLSLPDMQKVKRCILIFCIGLSISKFAGCYIGLLMYAEYENCDPLSVGVVKKLDQMLPLYTMNIGNKIPGLPGLVIAGIFAAALSSLSSTLNTLSGTIYADLIKPFLKNVNEQRASNIMKAIVMTLGAFELILVAFVEKFGSALHLTYSIHGFTSGTLLGIFTIGMISRKVNTKGVVAGSIVSLLAVGTILVGAQLSPKPPTLYFKTEGCFDDPSYSINITQKWLDKCQSHDEVPLIFRLSFMYYALIGITVLTLVAYPVSIFTGGCGEIDEMLLAPFVRRKTSKVGGGSAIYKTVQDALKSVENDINAK